MFVLTRKIGEKIVIGGNVVLTVVEIDRGKIRLGIEAPREISVRRFEKVSADAAVSAEEMLERR